MSVCDECRKKNYCSHECRKSKDESRAILAEVFANSKLGKMTVTLAEAIVRAKGSGI